MASQQDLITYKMIQNDPMIVDECVKGDGKFPLTRQSSNSKLP